MAEPLKVQYRVKKVTMERRLCNSCKGTKQVQIPLGNHQYKTVNCSTCDGLGVYSYEHQTETTLIEALTELGIRFILPESMKPKNTQQ